VPTGPRQEAPPCEHRGPVDCHPYYLAGVDSGDFPSPGQELLSRATSGALGGPDESQPGPLGVDILSVIQDNERKGVFTMTLPGIITGQPISGHQAGQAIFQFLPCLPHEGPPGMPRVLAKQLFPQGFIPGRIPAVAPMAPPVTQPLIPAQPPLAPPAPAANKVNQVVVTQPPTAPAQPAPQPAPLGYRRAASGGEAITARSQQIKIRERPGM